MAQVNYIFAARELLELLGALMQEPLLDDFALAGGTALAYHLHHRTSVDIDLFNLYEFKTQAIKTLFVEKYQASRIYAEPNTISAFIQDIKVDCLTHSYPLLSDLQIIDGVRLYALKDIAAMKLNAISGRGIRKDYWDIGVLLEHFSLQEMIGFFQSKYSMNDVWHLLKSLNEIDAADRDTTPIQSTSELSWDSIKRRIKLELQRII
ncbi:MAG TPA: nucleotidyl transferase AbiEii/AbiGii toxin family protein [Candidatus Cloacimonadota bacterium]|nr:nucleotidyl transferase AbiEii/AbiGii toxin family protein [Candidatus Cloacimonadota bacterium]